MQGAAIARARDVTFLLLAFGLTLLLQRSAPIQSDEGYTLNAAWQLWNGMRMYDDFRLFVGPGSGYAVYLTWHLVGSPSLLAARLVSLAMSFSATTGLWLILRTLGVRAVGLAGGVALWLAASALYVVMNHNPFSSFAAIWFLYFFLRALGSARPRDHALVGVAAGVVFLFLQTKGLFLVGAAGVFELFVLGTAGRSPSAPDGNPVVETGARRFAPLLALAGGFLLTIAPLALVWNPVVLVREWFIVPFTGNYLGHSTGSTALAVVVVAVTAAMVWAALRMKDRTLQAVAVTQAALVGSSLHNMELAHLAINSFPLVIFSVLLAKRRLPRPTIKPLQGPLLPMVALVALVAGLAASGAGRAFFQSSTLYVDLLKYRSRASRQVLSGDRLTAAHAIYVGPFIPGLYYLLGKKNPFFVSETIVCNLECQSRLVGELAAVKPELAILHYEMASTMGYDPNNPVDAYLRDRYVSCPGPFPGGLIVRALDPSWCP